MAGQLKKLAGPAFIAAAATNVYNSAIATEYTVIRHIHVANVTGGAVSFTLALSTTTGVATSGTELFKSHSVAANAEFDFYTTLKMLSTDFLVGLDGSGASLVITVEGEKVVV
jgi:hypothetical protein